MPPGLELVDLTQDIASMHAGDWPRRVRAPTFASNPKQSGSRQMSRSRAPYMLLGGWLLLAVLAGLSGRTAQLRHPAPQIVLGTLTLLCLAATLWAPFIRDWVSSIDVRSLTAFHLTRFVGIAFLLLYAKGQLPWAFAVPGGWGDIVVAMLAVLLLLLASPTTVRGRAAWIGWNILGFIDIIFVVGTAARLIKADPASMQAMLRLPLSLIPTFLVPLIITSHVVLFRRLRPPVPASA